MQPTNIEDLPDEVLSILYRNLIDKSVDLLPRVEREMGRRGLLIETTTRRLQT